MRAENTTPPIPCRNGSDEEIAVECEWTVHRLGVDVPLHFTAFHPDCKMREVPPTPPETLGRARAIALKAGLRHVYTGNVGDAAVQTTYCPGCGEALVTRDRYRIDRFALSDSGQCPRCGTNIPGAYEKEAGDLGARRQPIRLATSSQ